jgi:signal transduction histidine kinase/DNA-binding NarL/FixJ family response regulator
MNQDQYVTFLEEPRGVAASTTLPPWKIAIVDDDPAVHRATRFVLDDYRLSERGVDLISAHSAAEARVLLQEHPDTAILLLDVVMESDNAGLDLVTYIRRELKNELVRIILRTGQPGQAPEQRVIVDYDINDYKAKTELTADKLFTSITAALRSYEQLRKLVETRRGLEIIIDAAPTLFDLRSLQRLAEGVLTQLATLIDAECVGILVLREDADDQSFLILAGSGCYSEFTSRQHDSLQAELRELIDAGFKQRRHAFTDGRSVLYVGTGSGRELVVLLESDRLLSETDRQLVEVFCTRLSIAFDNLTLYERLQQANACLEERVAARTEELSAAHQALHSQWTRLREANALKNEILGVIAHDVKNPLSVILGRAEMLAEIIQRQPLPEAKAQDQITHIRTAASRLVDMANRLIGDALQDATTLELRTERLDLREIARQIVEANRVLAERKGQQLQLEDGGAVRVVGDADRLREVMDNLISNAIKYTPPGGEILVATLDDGAEALVHVTDTGPGLSPEDAERVFARFQRLSAKPTGGESSSGLGLSIAKRIVELHGGSITAGPSDRGTGARFTVALPRAADTR